jgi:small nuclear ribonucleoprotein G
MASKGPNLKAYLDKTIALHLNKGRRVTGTLRGYDQFMNIVLGDAVEETSGAGQNRIGMVVIRGNSIVQVRFSGRPLAFDPLFPCH